ncbi:MAG: BsuPI-related putative proteinase inhibitor [Armatimonadota bacterium]|nr:BsuPI-related putative proteinase inhibitor [Armatimonadota bacterium]MDR7401354.1 BsuPI-related putative proteinase inhibitor [Armatimonadota bacterium]MDR7437467.1 BsuPI-related putative proteinase inhibitor [Armatimonadota bacterium]MDR7472368.1 BsuPI-related putative proteinase inhibitor [Armatimonadota bacterium]MDR7506329.1 BsuPI-related putative proteinase inhibitor [Armatimonadota bacterium]
MDRIRGWVLAGLGAIALAGGPLVVEQVAGALRVEAALPRPAFAPGEPVEVTIAAVNRGEGPLALTFTSGQRFDLIVRRPRGDAVWQWSHDKAFIQVVQTVTLRPGERLSARLTWDQRDFQGHPVDPGPYEAVAVFLGRAGPGREMRLPPLAFVIVER